MSYVKTNWLDAATSVMTTDPEEVSGLNRFMLQVTVTGSPTQVGVALQGSIDGNDWMLIIDLPSATSFSGSVSFGPVKYVRLNLHTLTGGTAPTVSASLMATSVTHV